MGQMDNWFDDVTLTCYQDTQASLPFLRLPVVAQLGLETVLYPILPYA